MLRHRFSFWAKTFHGWFGGPAFFAWQVAGQHSRYRPQKQCAHASARRQYQSDRCVGFVLCVQSFAAESLLCQRFCYYRQEYHSAKRKSGLKSNDFSPLGVNMQLFPLFCLSALLAPYGAKQSILTRFFRSFRWFRKKIVSTSYPYYTTAESL